MDKQQVDYKDMFDRKQHINWNSKIGEKNSKDMVTEEMPPKLNMLHTK